MDETRWAFDGFEIDLDTREIRDAGEVVQVEPMVFDVVAYLVRHRGRVVPKSELLDELWGGDFVSESTLTSRIKAARQALGDNGRDQRVIKTSHGVGYRFVAHPEPLEPASVVAPRKRLIGRDSLVADLRERLEAGALVTLFGPAGVGKTHLAHHTAAAAEGSLFVPLANVRDGGSVGEAVLDALGVRRFEEATAVETAIEVLRSRAGLLVIDNCEHVRAAAADLIKRLRATSSQVTVLATSRQRLGVPGEQVMPVPPLAEADAVQLFVQRAAEHAATLDPDAAVVVDICRRLDQLPLALELASARVRILGVEELSALLDERMRLFESAGEVDAHHHTLETAIAWSFDALDPALQRTLTHYSAFAGPFDLDAACALAGVGVDIDRAEAVRHVVELAERSLLVPENDVAGTRYRLLESIRIFCEDRLDAQDLVQTAHLHHYVDAARRHVERLRGPEINDAPALFARDWDNFRTAVANACRLGRVEDAMELLAATVDYAELTQRYEHVDWAERVLALTDDEPPLATETKAGLSRLLTYRGELARAAALAEAAGPAERSFSTAVAHFWRAWFAGDVDGCEAAVHIADAQARDSRGYRELGVTTLFQFIAATAGRDPSDSGERARSIAAESAGPVTACFELVAVACETYRAGGLDETIRECDHLVELASANGLELLVMAGTTTRAMALQSYEDLDAVAWYIRDGLVRYRERGQWTVAAGDAPVGARVLFEAGRVDAAAQILGARVASGFRGGRSTAFAAELGAQHDVQLTEAFARGRQMSAAELCDFAISELDELLSDA